MKKFILTSILLGLFSTGIKAAWDETGYYYPDLEPDDIWTEWEDFNQCDIEWGGMNAGFFSYDVQVKKRVSKDPSNHKFQWSILDFFASGAELVVEYNPDDRTFRIPIQRHGVNNMWDGEPFLSTDWKTFYGTDDPYSSWDEVNGVLELYIIDYYPNQNLGDGTYGDQLYAAGITKLRFQGFVKYDVDILTDECAASFDTTADLVLTPHPSNVSWELLNEYVNKFDTEKLQEIAARKANPISETATVNLTLKEGPNSLVVISYDNKNNMVASIKNIYCMPDDDDNWNSLGKGKFTEDAIMGLGGDWDSLTVEVEIQENKDRAGYYRLVNPYVAVAEKYDDLEYVHEGHNHYIYINASKPNQVILETSATGINHPSRLKSAYLTSKAYECKRAGMLQPEYVAYMGRLQDGVITFPEGSIGVRLPEYTNVIDEDVIYWVNNNGEFSIELPVAGLREISSVEQTAPEYYTIQGIRIENPQDGQLVIVRSNGKSVKTVYRK